MVDFSLTDADKHYIDLIIQEHEIGRRYAREIDRTSEYKKPEIRPDHPDLEGFPDPYELLEEHPEGTSGEPITHALMYMATARDVTLRADDHGFGNMVLNDFGTEEQKARYGHLRLAIGLTEPGAGSDPGNMSSNWRYDIDSGDYVLNGEKVFISSINKYDGAVTLLRGLPDEHGQREFSSFVVLKDAAGFHEVNQFKKMGLRQFDIGGFTMDNLRVPAVAKLDADFGRTFSRFNHNRPLVAAQAMGACRSMLDFTKAKLAEEGLEIDFAKGARGRSATEDKLIRMEALWEATWGSIMRVKWLQQQMGTQSTAYRTEASAAKALGGRASRTITQGCLELLGPEALSEAYFAEKWFRDVRIADIYEGAGEIMRIMVARSLFGYRKGELQ